MRLGFEAEGELLGDFISQFPQYRNLGKESLEKRHLSLGEGRFGKGLVIGDGWPISKGAWNESGLDCDLIVATMWGEWHTKPHYWGSGGFHGDSGSLAFWVKKQDLYPGVVFMQGHIGWGRAERDLFNVEVDEEGKLHAFIRDVQYAYHRVESASPVWQPGVWQHIAAVWDRAYGIKLFHNGELVGTSWGQDAWWRTGHPGLFSPFLPEASYDEIVYYDFPLSEDQVRELYETNQVASLAKTSSPEAEARERLFSKFMDEDRVELPEFMVGAEWVLSLKQVVPARIHDGAISAGWVMDGRYELAWPHPYRMFTFILGDVDFKGTTIQMELEGEAIPNHVYLEGVLEDVQIRPASGEEVLLDTGKYGPQFFSSPIEVKAASKSLRVPLIEGYGNPPGLEGSAHLPLTGEKRIHEMSLWETESVSVKDLAAKRSVVWSLNHSLDPTSLPRYGNAFKNLLSQRERTAVAGESMGTIASESLSIEALMPFHLLSSGLDPDIAVDRIALDLHFRPNRREDILLIRLRDPANPGRFWSQAAVRLRFPTTQSASTLHLSLDIPDLMLASEDRLWVELVSRHGGVLTLGGLDSPSRLGAVLSETPEAAIASYTERQIEVSQLQFSKEYNYRPWTLTGEMPTLSNWSQFGGPFDIGYPILAALRHAPDHPLANRYEEIVFHRGRRAWVPEEAVKRPLEMLVPGNAPEWAVWQRELLKINLRVGHWIANHQREDGQFWGGWNDDSFIPLGFPSLPLLGDEPTRRAWLRFYEGLEEAGIFADGYCDIWPIDPLHITDYIASRGLMLAFDLGNPQVFERELRTAERYTAEVAETNARLAAEGKPLLSANSEGRERKDISLVEQMEAEILDYSATHLNWYLGRSQKPEPHAIEDPTPLARQMRDTVLLCDDTTEYDFTESMIHTDGQGVGIGRNELVSSMLGGRLQGRVESHPHSIAVSWEGEEEPSDLGRLVRYADDRSLTLDFFNFQKAPVKTTARFWRLLPGKYRLNFQSIEPDRPLNLQVERDLVRFSTVELTVAPELNCRLHLELMEEHSTPADLADLAISEKDLAWSDEGHLRIAVHNLGAASVESANVAIWQGEDLVAEKEVGELGTPAAEWKSQWAEVVVENLDRSQGEILVVLDPAEKLREIFEENNRVRMSP
jgi:hypothetical protein